MWRDHLSWWSRRSFHLQSGEWDASPNLDGPDKPWPPWPRQLWNTESVGFSKILDGKYGNRNPTHSDSTENEHSVNSVDTRNSALDSETAVPKKCKDYPNPTSELCELASKELRAPSLLGSSMASVETELVGHSSKWIPLALAELKASPEQWLEIGGSNMEWPGALSL